MTQKNNKIKSSYLKSVHLSSILSQMQLYSFLYELYGAQQSSGRILIIKSEFTRLKFDHQALYCGTEQIVHPLIICNEGSGKPPHSSDPKVV